MPFVEVTLIEGRTSERKRELMKRITDVVEETCEVPRQSIRVVLREVPGEHWAVGGEPKGAIKK